MSALALLNEILLKEAGKPVLRAGGSQGRLFRDVSQRLKAPGPQAHATMTSVQPVAHAEQAAAQAAGARDALRQHLSRSVQSSPQITTSDAPASLARLSPGVRGDVRRAVQPASVPHERPGAVVEAAKSRSEGAAFAGREGRSLDVRTAPTVTATEKVSPQLAAAKGRVTPEQKSVVIPEKKRPFKFEAKQQRQEAEAVVRGKDFSQELGHEKSKEIAQATEQIRAQHNLSVATTKPSEKPVWVAPSKHEVRTELAAKYDKPAPKVDPSHVRDVVATRAALRRHVSAKGISLSAKPGVATS